MSLPIMLQCIAVVSSCRMGNHVSPYHVAVLIEFVGSSAGSLSIHSIYQETTGPPTNA